MLYEQTGLYFEINFNIKIAFLSTPALPSVKIKNS